jgi:chromate reductase, NAD(P)H dehydrogenase (quinone)
LNALPDLAMNPITNIPDGARPLRLAGLTNRLCADSYNRMTLGLVDATLAPRDTLALLDLRAVPFFDPALERDGLPASVLELAATLAWADGLVIASPEYNHSVPAALKNALDWLSRTPGRPLEEMPVMLLSATRGALGGARVQYELRRVLDAVGARPLVAPEVFIAMAHTKFDAQGRCTDAPTREWVARQLEAFRRWIARAQRRPATARSAHAAPA